MKILLCFRYNIRIMKKIELPSEYKDMYHIKEEDLSKLNKHIEEFERENRRKKVIKRYIWGFMLLIFISTIIFGILDFNDLKSFFFGKTFLIKRDIKFNNDYLEIRITRPSEKILSLIFFSYGDLEIIVSNSFEYKRVFLSKEPKVENIRYDNKVFFIKDDKHVVINVENLKVME